MATDLRSRPENLDIYDPDRYVEGVPHDVFDHLRLHQPVFWQDIPDGRGYWAVLKHADVVEVARQPDPSHRDAAALRERSTPSSR